MDVERLSHHPAVRQSGSDLPFPLRVSNDSIVVTLTGSAKLCLVYRSYSTFTVRSTLHGVGPARCENEIKLKSEPVGPFTLSHPTNWLNCEFWARNMVSCRCVGLQE